MRATPKPALRLVGEASLPWVRRIQQVFRTKHTVDVTAIQRLVFQDVEGLQTELAVEARIEAQLNGILIRLRFPLRPVEAV